MFEAEELKLSKEYVKWNREISSELTKEELLLKSKYEELRRAKALLSRYRTTGTCKSPVKRITVNPKPMVVSKQKENFCKKTSDFKHWSKQSQENVTRSYTLHSFEDDAKPRSVKVSGKNLTDEFFHKHCSQFGEIWKIRTNEERTCSVLTFKRPSSALKIVEVLNGMVIDGVQLDASLMHRNTSWNEVDSLSAKLAEIQNVGKSVYVRFNERLVARDFEDFFYMVGKVTRIYLNHEKHFGYVMFENEKQAQRAIAEMDGEIYNGDRIHVSMQRGSNWNDSKPTPQSLQYNKDREMVSYEDLEH